MARPIIVNFPAASSTYLYAVSVAGGAAGVIPLAIPYPVVFSNIARPITLTSTDNLSAVNFTITGFDQYGTAISEVLAGPNNNTVHSVNSYNIISSIVSSGAYTNFSAGTYSTGFIQWIPLNYQITPENFTIQVVATATINYSMFQTLDRLGYYQSVGGTVKYVPPSSSNITQFAITAALTAATTSQIYTSVNPCNAIALTVNSSSGAGALTLTVIQSGV